MKKFLSILLIAGVALAIMIPAQAEETVSNVTCTEWMPLQPGNPKHGLGYDL